MRTMIVSCINFFSGLAGYDRKRRLVWSGSLLGAAGLNWFSSANYTESVQSNTLQRILLLSFSYKFLKFNNDG